MADTGFNAGAGYPVNQIVDGNLTAVDVYGTSQYGTITARNFVGSGAGLTNLPSSQQNVEWINVTLSPYTADKTGATDSTTTIQAALTAAGLAGAGVVYAPAGTYKYTNLTIPNGVTLVGDGSADNSTNGTIFKSYATSGDSISWTSGWNITIRDILFDGANTTSTIGIHGKITGTSASFFINMERVQVQNFTSHGIELQLTCVSTFTNVISKGNTGHAFYVTGILGGASGTSCTFNSCWGWNSTNYSGWLIVKMTYCTWNSCASDNNAAGYLIEGCQGCTFNGCGAEGIVAAGAYDGTQFKVMADSSSEPCNCVVLNGCWTLSNKAVAFWVTGSSVNTVLLALTEGTPISATASIKTDTGSDSTIIGYNVTTATALTSGTYNSLQSGQLSTYSTAYLSATNTYGVLGVEAGSNTATSASITNTLGATNGGSGVRVSATTDVIVYLACNTAGTSTTVSIGHTTSANDVSIISNTSVGVGLVSFRLPAGWYFKWAGTTTTFSVQNAVGC